jgi:hypothetical protein
MRNPCFVLVIALSMRLSIPLSSNPAEAAQTGSAVVPAMPPVVIGDFSDRVRDYVKLRKNAEDSFSGVTTSKDSERLATHKIELAQMIVMARRDARQGDIFTPEIALRFCEIIRKTLQARGAQAVRRTIQDKDPAAVIVLRVNAAYPEDYPLQTMPPTLLGRVPDLPMDMGYRIIGRSFVLLDNKTRLIIDLIPDAIP